MELVEKNLPNNSASPFKVAIQQSSVHLWDLKGKELGVEGKASAGKRMNKPRNSSYIEIHCETIYVF